MDRRSSPIADLYGVSPEHYSPRHKSHAWLYVLLTIAGFFVFESIEPVMRLRPDPPPSVVGAGLNPQGASKESLMRTARACWDYAVESLQDAYPYGKALPRNPPSSFTGKAGSPSGITELCWPRLRNAWGRRESWVPSYGWSTDWLTNPNGPFQRAFFNILNTFGISH